MSCAEIAEGYGRRGWSVLPLPPRSKAPTFRGWQSLRLTDAVAIQTRFKNPKANIGVLLGEPSGWLVDVDLDHPDARECGSRLLPQTDAVFGRAGNPRSHWLYQSTGPVKTLKRAHKSLGMLVELRSTGAQTVFPGSIHPSGEHIEWESDGEPAEVDPAVLLLAINNLADTVLRKHGLKPQPKASTRRKTASMSPATDGDHPPMRTRDLAPVSERVRRARAYVEQVEPAISGQGGHNATFRVAKLLLQDFALPRAESMTLLREYSSRCEPPWSQTELDHKLETADSQVDSRRYGCKVKASMSIVVPTEPNLDHRAGAAGGIPRTDVGNGIRFRYTHCERVRYCHEWQKWLIWDGRRWEPDRSGRAVMLAKETARGILKEAYAVPKSEENDETYKALVKFAAASESKSRLTAMLWAAQSEPGIPVLPEELDCNPWLLNVANGTLDLQTGELREHRRSDLLTKLTPIAFDNAADCPKWLAFLERATGGDVDLQRYLQRLVGYCLTGRTTDHIVPFLFGTGANGKSVFVNTILALMGDDYAMKAPSTLLMAKRGESHPTEQADLFGRRLAACVETEEGRRLAESLVKELSGGDKVRARRMRQDFFEFTPTHKVWIVGNHKPVVAGTDHGVWRRLRLIPFTVTIPADEQDKSLPDKLRTELPGILLWAIAGCLQWQQEGLGEPGAVKAATNTYRCEEDVLAEFLADCCVIAPAGRVGVAELYESYSRWCEANRESPLTKRKFGRRLDDRGFECGKATAGKRVRCGIRLKTEGGVSGVTHVFPG